MGAFLARILSWLASAFGIQLSASVAQFVANRVVLYTLFVVILPVILNNLLVTLYQEIMTIVSNKVTGSGFQPMTASLSGCTGYLAGLLNIPECFSMLLSASAFRVALKFIPFIRL
jgi:hypothetical protein